MTRCGRSSTETRTPRGAVRIAHRLGFFRVRAAESSSRVVSWLPSYGCRSALRVVSGWIYKGLRAIAVMLVVLCHAGMPLFAGGNVGVDVFFVISGFLITGWLVRRVKQEGRVPFAAFYAARARRILPAAALVLVVTAIASRFFLNYVRRCPPCTTASGRPSSLRMCISRESARTTSHGPIHPRRCSSSGRWPWRSSSTSHGRRCWPCSCSACGGCVEDPHRAAEQGARDRGRRRAGRGLVRLVVLVDAASRRLRTSRR